MQNYIKGSLKMGIQSFLKATKGDPDWAFTPEQYFEKEFKLIDANLIELGQGKTDKIILRQTPTEKEMLAKHLRIDVRENAKLDVTIINEASDKLQQVFLYDIRVREGGHINLGAFIKGGKLNKHIFQVILDDGANFNAYGYAHNDVGGDSEFITKIEHQGPYSVSSQYFVSEAGKNSQTVFQSMINIFPDANYSQVGIENENLITGDEGRCQSVPEVYNHTSTSNVSNATVTNPLEDDKVYYLQSRGISKADAKALLISAHRKAVLNILQNSEIKEEVEQLLVD
jgi:Fe-S cluster assembly protein SufD